MDKAYHIDEYTIQAQTLTPLHIGTGEMVYPHEYLVTHDGNADTYTLYRFHVQTLYTLLTDGEKNEFRKLSMHKGPSAYIVLRKWVKDVLDSNTRYKDEVCTHALYEASVDEETWEAYEKGGGEKEAHSESNQLQISEHIKSGGEAYIPGSSLKGSIRTALTVYEIEGNPRDRIHYRVEEDPFKRLMVTDSEGIPAGHMRVARLYRSHISFDFLEYLAPDTRFTFQIKTKNHLEVSRRYPFTFDAKKIARSCTDFTKEKVQTHRAELARYRARLGEIGEKKEREYMHAKETSHDQRSIKMLGDKCASLKKLAEATETLDTHLTSLQARFDDLAQNQFILSVGFGTGYWMKTLLPRQGLRPAHPAMHMCKTVPDADIPIARTYTRVAGGDILSDESGMPFGFVLCTISPRTS